MASSREKVRARTEQRLTYDVDITLMSCQHVWSTNNFKLPIIFFQWVKIFTLQFEVWD